MPGFSLISSLFVSLSVIIGVRVLVSLIDIPRIATHDSVLFLPLLLSTHVYNLFPSTCLQEISGH